jgi:AbrB family looped-hinge helix DNA binding protein
MRSCKLTTKFQTTIPKEIRQKLDLKAGDRVNFEVHETTGHVIVKKAQCAESSAAQPSIKTNDNNSPVVIHHDDWRAR